MPALIFIRHSTPKIDPATSSTAWMLSEAGVHAAHALAKSLTTFKPSAVLSSPERKAHSTATIIARRSEVPVIMDDALREHYRASTGFLPADEFTLGVERLLRSPHELVFGDETAEAVFLRFGGVVDRAKHLLPDGDHIFVSHGTAIAIYVGRVLGHDPVALWRELKTPTAVIIRDDSMEMISPSNAAARCR